MEEELYVSRVFGIDVPKSARNHFILWERLMHWNAELSANPTKGLHEFNELYGHVNNRDGRDTPLTPEDYEFLFAVVACKCIVAEIRRLKKDEKNGASEE